MGLSAINLAGGTIVTKKMLDMFRRPDDPPEFNGYYLLPGAAAVAGSSLLFATGAAPTSLAPMLAMGSALGCVGGISCLSSQKVQHHHHQHHQLYHLYHLCPVFRHVRMYVFNVLTPRRCCCWCHCRRRVSVSPWA